MGWAASSRGGDAIHLFLSAGMEAKCTKSLYGTGGGAGSSLGIYVTGGKSRTYYFQGIKNRDHVHRLPLPDRGGLWMVEAFRGRRFKGGWKKIYKLTK